MKTLFNGNNDEDFKTIHEKDIRLFLNFMDVDRNGTISKAAFLKQYSKIDSLSQRQYPLYKLTVSKEEVKKASNLPENDLTLIVRKMQAEGINLNQFLGHLPTLTDINQDKQTRLIRLGSLLK